MESTKRLTPVVGFLTFLASFAVYLRTMQKSVPFWDSGEFIAVSHILGIPHPPGTPFYVVLGHLATLVPIGSIADRVNGLSALVSALAVMITFLTTVRLIRMCQGAERKASDEWIAWVGGAVGALLLGFSDNFWENATEAEVYSIMSLAQILVFWMGLRWWEAHEKKPTAGPLLMCVYVMWLSVGLHLGVGMMGLPLVVLVALVDRSAALVFAMPLLSVLLCTYGLERMVGVVLLMSTITYMVFAWQRKLDGWVVFGGLVGSIFGMYYAFTDADFTRLGGIVSALAVLVPAAFLARRHREGRIILIAVLLMVIGYSTHLYLPIRAAQHPAINEGNPSNWANLRDLLERKQYGSTSMFIRRGPLITQLDKEFWRYFKRQWPLFPTERLWGALLPLLLGIAGAVWNFRREKTSFWVNGVMFAFATAGMILFLNFTDHEVRDRDYFFTTAYHWYAIWIGMGVAWLIAWVRDSFDEPMPRNAAGMACAVLLLAQPPLLVKNLWYTHDRNKNQVAHDYAYNMLAPLAPNAFVYTNGDNDTFPLWYIQQVENFRKDVRVVNLSLLNTDWYIFQLRDEEPKVPIALDDATIRALGQGAIQDEKGNIIYTNQFMVRHIMQQDRRPDGSWKKPPYFAVTVPEHMGFDKYFTLEGLVYRVNRDTLGPVVDMAATRKALYQTFLYRGLFKADGSWDSTVYKDENAATLSRNYAAAHLQMAFEYQKAGDLKGAIGEMERVERMFPGFVDVLVPLGKFYLDSGDTAKAVELFDRLVKQNPNSPEAHYYRGVTAMFRRQYPLALQSFDRSRELDPDYFYPYVAAYTLLWEGGERERGLQYLKDWLDRHPDDAQVRQLYDGNLRALGHSPGATNTRPAQPSPFGR
jgi:tetratricopeptide (TPR) repeat protein